MTNQRRRTFLQAASAGVLTGVAGCSSHNSSPEELARSHRESLSKYKDVTRALEDGYRMSTPYVRSGDKVLGLPFFNFNEHKLEPKKPAILFYDLLDDGTFELLGVEWLVPAESTDSPPSIFGKELDGPMPGETAFIPKHYGLHAWLFKDNPDGLFARYHPDVEPPSYIEDLETVWNALSPYYANLAKAEKEGGYHNTETCIANSEGAYGVPVVQTDRVGTDLRKPPVLMYRLTSSWNYQMMGAEWYLPVGSTDSRPSLFGQEFHDPMDGHTPKFDQGTHYGLHTWLFTANPKGMFAPFNPAVKC